MKNLEFNLNSLLNSFIYQITSNSTRTFYGIKKQYFKLISSIWQVTDDNFLVTLALVGYEKYKMDISIKEDTLIIRCKIDSDKEKNFAYKVIASR